MSYKMSGRKTLNNKRCASSTDEEEMTDVSFKKNNNIKTLSKSIPDMFPNTMEQTRRRGRGPSKRPCLNRNALMARENRLRKKAYLEKIENTLSYYQQENKNLTCTIQKQGIDIKRLTGEVAYLKSVLNNNTAITALLKTINEGLKRLENHKKKSEDQVQDKKFKTKGSEVQEKCTTCIMDSKENISDSLNYNIFNSTMNGYCITSTKNLEQEQTDNSYENGKYQQKPDKMLPVTSATSLSTSDGSKSTNVTDMDFDELSPFNVDIFEDLPKCDDIMNSIDLNDPSSSCIEEDLFQTLDNTGICLHVNSDKVSLEYCAFCHMNSKSSEVE